MLVRQRVGDKPSVQNVCSAAQQLLLLKNEYIAGGANTHLLSRRHLKTPHDPNSLILTRAHPVFNALLQPFLLCSAVLTGLTSLQLAGFGAAVDNTVALALAGSLRNLQHLDLRGCDCGSKEVVQKLERLPMLRELLLDVHAGGCWHAELQHSSRSPWATQVGQLHGPRGFQEPQHVC